MDFSNIINDTNMNIVLGIVYFLSLIVSYQLGKFHTIRKLSKLKKNDLKKMQEADEK